MSTLELIGLIVGFGCIFLLVGGLAIVWTLMLERKP
jgi:hypothetical protein